MRRHLRSFFSILFLGLSLSSIAQASVYPSKEFDLPEDEPYRKIAQFWVDVYGKYTSHQGLIHDTEDVTRVYEIVDFSGLNQHRANQLIKMSKIKWRTVLKRCHENQKTPEKLSDDEKRVFFMFPEEEGPRRFLNAMGRRRMRFQLGQKDHFENSVEESGRYLPLMEDIFRAEGVPAELTRLPFVESSFNLKARSKVGASGIWQFMSTTGRLYLKVNDVVDERNDPIRATEAAAKLLKQNYESLQSWPLAVVAYNHGRMGMMRAVGKVGSNDLRDILANYKSRSFGFASRNFFWELVGAVHVEKEYKTYFPNVVRQSLAQYTPVTVKDYISARDLAQGLGIPVHEFQMYNPGFTSAVFSGFKRIPPGYPVRIPDDWGKDKGGVTRAFEERYALIPKKFKHQGQR
jgi:membrane-bound lytic murein transglycosylase D